ncbi:glycoside hydrolase domain-containing protein [Fodinicola acaciae]|uniref:glycoside hydrolase domain-containing protein n=1 Tax=Fodinicola acaciae TaxID=2681555 RepID=UPI0013D7A8AC|nr:glycoside hydrolase domain-containing protein [Fodinicola acaciae]
MRKWQSSLLVAAVVAAVGLSAPATAATEKVVTYRGYQLTVPATWSVVDLQTAPRTCVRFDQHTVYLGHSTDSTCPVNLVGVTEAVAVEPLATANVPANARKASSLRQLPHSTDHRVSLEVDAAGLLVTGSYGDQPTALQRILASGKVTSAARAGAAPKRTLAVSPQVAAPGTFTGRGFDACTAPSSNTMSAWLNSPYRGVGVYIGGINRACSQANLTASWVSQQDSRGWHIFPIYVGLQAPCWSGSGSKINPATALSQGQAAAQDAATKAQSLGISGGSVIYNDMEGYGRGGSCTQGVLDFLNGWTTQLHALGYGSGVYSSSASGIADLVAVYGGSYPSPDHVYFARWNNVADTNDSAIPASYWSNHQRIHQYAGGHNETYGGVTINIDSDALDVTTAGGGSSTIASQAYVVGGEQHYMGRGTDGSLSHSWWTPGTGGTGLSQDSWAPAGAVAGQPITFLTSSVGVQQHAFAIDGSGNLQHYWWSSADPPHSPEHDTWNAASSTGITLTGTPTGFVFGSEQHVFARDTAGNLQHWFWFPDGTAAGSMNHDVWDSAGDVASDPVGIVMGGAQHVFFTTSQGDLRHWSWKAGGTPTQESWATGVTGRPAVFSAGDEQHVFIPDSAGNLQHYWLTADGQKMHDVWNDASSSGIAVAGTPSGFVYGNQQHVFARDTQGRLQHWTWSPGSSVQQNTWDASGTVAGNPTALVIGSQQHVFFANSQGQLRHWFNNGDANLLNDTWPTATTLAAP